MQCTLKLVCNTNSKSVYMYICRNREERKIEEGKEKKKKGENKINVAKY